jgi:hypothetical protein
MTSNVSISARVVAAGPSTQNGDKVRLTLSLMPVKLAAGPIEMANWPLHVHRFLKDNKLRLVAEMIPLEPGTRPPAPSGIKGGKELPYDPSGGFDTIAADVQNLWRDIGADALTGLDGYNAASSQVGQFWTALAEVFTVDDTANGAEPQIPTIVATGRGDAAVLHVLARAKRLAARLLPPKNELGVTIKEGPATLASWASLNAYDDSEQKNMERLRTEALADERKDVADRLTTYVTTHRPNLKSLLDSLGGTVNAAPVSGTRPTLVSHPIQQLFGDDKASLKIVQDLHVGMLLPDDPKATTRPKGALSPGKAGKLEASSPDAPVAESFEYLARTFIMAVRSSPMLARLFRFVVDVEIDLEALPPEGTAADKK